ncbi:MAG: hypothetical protein AVDCRST_MAG93-4482, partial [uncultured Chloroflexia bacterium]
GTVYLSAPVEVCRQRDHSGAYLLADSGRIASFPGVSATFEVPTEVDLVLPTHEMSAEQCVERIVKLLEDREFVS